MDTAHNNKTLLLLLAGLLLLIFMDVQAGRHSRTLAAEPGRKIEERGRELEEKLEPLLRPVKKSAREAFGVAEGIPAGIDSRGTDVGQSVPKAARRRGRLGDVVDPSPLNRAPDGATAVTHTPVRLFFLRFHGGRPRTVEVKRRLVGNPTPERLLQLLREGPLARERGLLSAVESVPFGSVRVRDGVAVVEAGSALARNGPRLVRARIDQVVHTLTQLPEIREVRFSIDGEVLDTLAGVPVMSPKGRRSP